MTLTALTYVAWPYPAGVPSDMMAPVGEVSGAGRIADFGGEAGALKPPTGGGAGSRVDEQGHLESWLSFDDVRGWHDFAVELWPLTYAGGRWTLAAQPMLTVPYDVRGSDLVARWEEPRPRDPAWFVRLETAVAPDGVRTILPGGFQAQRTLPWRGSVLDWWLGR